MMSKSSSWRSNKIRHAPLRPLDRTHRVYDPKASQGGRHFKLVESICFVLVEVPERAFELF